MKIKAIKTSKINPGDNLNDILDRFVKNIPESAILVIGSKIVSICQNNIVPLGKIKHFDLIKKESDLFLPPDKYCNTITIKQGILAQSAGIDTLKGIGHILWPKKPQQTVNAIRKKLIKKFKLQNFGVIIADSRTAPLRVGKTGVAISYSGFLPFDRFSVKYRVNLLDALTAAAVLVMGEGMQSTPMALVTDIDFIQFCQNNPTQKELREFYLKSEKDIYCQLIKNIPWQKGGSFSG